MCFFFSFRTSNQCSNHQIFFSNISLWLIRHCMKLLGLCLHPENNFSIRQCCDKLTIWQQFLNLTPFWISLLFPSNIAFFFFETLSLLLHPHTGYVMWRQHKSFPPICMQEVYLNRRKISMRRSLYSQFQARRRRSSRLPRFHSRSRGYQIAFKPRGRTFPFASEAFSQGHSCPSALFLELLPQAKPLQMERII